MSSWHHRLNLSFEEILHYSELGMVEFSTVPNVVQKLSTAYDIGFDDGFEAKSYENDTAQVTGK